MVFAGTETAARIERAECDLLRAAAAALTAEEPCCDPWAEDLAGGVAVFASEGMPFNKLAGLGFAGVPDPDRLEEVEAELRRRTGRIQAEVASRADPGVAAMLARRGCFLEGIENVLGRALDRRRPARVVWPGTELICRHGWSAGTEAGRYGLLQPSRFHPRGFSGGG